MSHGPPGGDPFNNWRRQTGHTGARGDYDDDTHNDGHKTLAADYARNHRPLSNAARLAAAHPGGHAKHYVREKGRKETRVFNDDPARVSWASSVAQLKEAGVYHFPKERFHEHLEGTWDRESPRIDVRQNKASRLLRYRLEEPAVRATHSPPPEDAAPSLSLQTLNRKPGLPFYSPRAPVLTARTNRSADLRRELGRSERARHLQHTGRAVARSRKPVHNLDVRRWVDNLDQLATPRAYFQYRMQPRRRWVSPAPHLGNNRRLQHM
jgi:hypothetical protein